MRCLWLTRKLPIPANSGELIYSAGLINCFADTDVDLTVIAHDNNEVPSGGGAARSTHCDDHGVNWRLGTPQLNGRWPSLFTALPSDSYRLKNGGPADEFKKALEKEKWDAVVIEHAATGWGLKPFLKHFPDRNDPDRPKLIYISHNHEAKVRREVAQFANDPFPKNVALELDARKYARQEVALCKSADLVTAITETEADAYREDFPDQRYLCLTPGYDGPGYPDRVITEATPRRVLMTGSFEWIAKRLNLEKFLEIAARQFDDAGIEVQIVGKTDPEFQKSVSKRFRTVDFVGSVPDVTPYLLDARMGLIVETVGGGFKLKSLDYIYHRLPLAGLIEAVEGLPLKSPDDILLMRSLPTLIREVVDAIDDIDRLNRMACDSWDKCQGFFDWQSRGESLYEAVASL